MASRRLRRVLQVEVVVTVGVDGCWVEEGWVDGHGLGMYVGRDANADMYVHMYV